MGDVRPFVGNRNRCLRILKGATHNFEKNLLRVRWSERDEMCAAGSADQNVNIWDMRQLQLAYRLPGHTGSVNEVCFHPKEPIVASAASDRYFHGRARGLRRLGKSTVRPGCACYSG